MYQLDHILWASSDLETGTQQMAERLGVAPSVGGRHPGFGTCNSLLSLGEQVYLEIIAPDPSQDLKGTRGARLAALKQPKILTYAVRCFDMAKVEKLVMKAGLETKGAIAMSRKQPDGHLLEWQVLRIINHPYADFLPFFINWGNTPHPAQTTPKGCELLEFSVAYTNDLLLEVYRALEIGVAISLEAESRFQALLKTPKGALSLS